MNQKEIRIYGTLVNNTIDNTIGKNEPDDKNQHNDALAYAKQLYDDKFGDTPNVNNFQDVINKRIKGITRKVENPNAGTYINENLYVDGTIYVKDANGNYVPLSFGDIISRIEALEANFLWKITGDYIEPKDATKKIRGNGFYDSSVN